MPSTSPISYRNRILTAMAADDLAVIQPHFESVELPLRAVLVEADEPVEYVHYLESGIASIIATSIDDEQIEVGHVGREGMTGNSICLGVPIGSTKTFMQVSGYANRIKADVFLELLEARPSLRSLMHLYLYTAQIQVAHSALANARYSLRERLARWLLMCHDRVDDDDIPMTHEFLSLMLGVRRAGVTGELHILEGLSVIKATRRNVRVLDRARMEEIAGGSYGLPEAMYERLIGAVRS